MIGQQGQDGGKPQEAGGSFCEDYTCSRSW